jgi:hypothetical protein
LPDSTIHNTDDTFDRVGLFLEYRASAGGWILRLMTQLHKCRTPKLREIPLSNWTTLGLGELAGSIATRHHLLRLIARRINAHVSVLVSEFDHRTDDVEWCLGGPRAFTPKNEEVAYQLLIDSHALVFEAKALEEHVLEFGRAFSAAIGMKMLSQNEFGQELLASGADLAWLAVLGRLRNELIHEICTWPAFEVRQQYGRRQYGLVLLRENVLNLADPDKFVRLGDLADPVNGLFRTLDVIEGILAKWIEKADAAYGS